MQERITQTLSVLLFLSLLLWGGYTLIFYLGVPSHIGVLLSPDQQDTVVNLCGRDGAFLCRGWQSLFPFLLHTAQRAFPFLWYGIVSLTLAGGLFLWNWVRTGRFGKESSLSVLHIFLLFLFSLWLFLTVLGFGSVDGQPLRRVFEPLPQVYTNATPETLDALQRNFDDLHEGGCLVRLGQTTSGAGVYTLKLRCLQWAFFTRVLPAVLTIALFLLELLTLGRFLLSLLRIPPESPLLEALWSLGLGTTGWIVILWFLALLKLFTPVAGWFVLCVIPLLGYAHVQYWCTAFFSRRWRVFCTLWDIRLVFAWLLLSLLAFNFLNVLRPFPIGWDDLGSYINNPRLLVSYSETIPNLSSFKWEYLTALGFLLFGYDSTFGAVIALLINWTEGLLAVLTIFAFARVFLGGGGGVLSALLYYILPLVGHFSFADMKVDNAVFFTGALGMLAMYLYLFPLHDEDNGGGEFWQKWPYLVLSGMFVSLSFSMKITAAMVFTVIIATILGKFVGWSGFLSGVLLGFFSLLYQGALNLTQIFGRIVGGSTALPRGVMLGLLAGSALLIVIPRLIRAPQRFLVAVLSIGVFGGSFFVTALPWLTYNNIQHGNTIPSLALTAPNTFTPTIEIAGDGGTSTEQQVRALPHDLRVDPAHPACKGTAREEELDRYWGYGQGWGHYFTLPWRIVMNLDSAGYYVTTLPALLLFPLLLLMPFFWRRCEAWLRWLFFGTLFMLLQWMFLANGIPWYGVSILLGLCIGLEALVYRAPDRSTKLLAGTLVSFSLLIGLGMRLWQYEQMKNIFEYPLGKVSAEAMRERTIPHYNNIRDVVLARAEAMPDRPFVYRIGTFIPYFIPRNLEIVPIADNQLVTFNCLYQERDAKLTLRRLQLLGFNSMIFDTNTATIERDSQGTLHQKVNAFLDFANTPKLGLQILVNDVAGGIAFLLLP